MQADLTKYKYYFSHDSRYKDISSIDWLTYDDNQVVMASKKQLAKLHDVDLNELYKDDKNDFYYHPVAVAQCALGCFNLMINGQAEKYENTFWANINWLAENGIEHENSLVYPFPYALPNFNKNPMWVSGMYQGQVLSCFIRASLLKDKEKYLELAKSVWNSFSLKLGTKYGFRYEKNDELWFEESPQFPPSHILNGSIYALWGLYDYLEFSNETKLQEDYSSSLRTIKKNLKKYDAGFWSYYDLHRTIATYYYHNEVHPTQLRSLYNLSGDEEFLIYAQKWEGYGKSRWKIFRKKITSLWQKFFK